MNPSGFRSTFSRHELLPLSLGRATASQIDRMFQHRDERQRVSQHDFWNRASAMPGFQLR